jgi:anaerobic carbon-monoxide dehydrogenase iron sulfur subunit
MPGKTGQGENGMNDKILVNPELCSGCRICQLACSFTQTGIYNPSASHILIEDRDAARPARITFTTECTECGTCSRYCFYGALKQKEEVEA